MKTLLTLVIALGLTVANANAHCGACGTGNDHAHAKKASAQETASIIETAKAAGNFNTLLAAVEAADLKKALSGDGPFTVFAPTDEAFAALPEGTIEALLKDKEKLASILTYHVVEGKVKANDVTKIEKAQTLNGQSFAIMVKNDKVMIDNAEVIMTDIICSNGVIHVIDAVILPQDNNKKG